MSSRQDTSVIKCAALYILATCVIGLVLYLIVKDPAPMPDGWVQSYVMAAPDRRPIVGMWLDGGQPVVNMAVAHGGTWYEYNPTAPTAPLLPIWHEPPIWWVDMPGSAR